MNYSDPVDRADAIESNLKKMRINAIRSQGRELSPKGTCHFCKEEVEGQKLFCDKVCAEDYERNKKVR